MITDPNRLLAVPEKRNTKFQLGNPGGPGRPKGLTKRQYLDALYQAVKPSDLKHLMQKVFNLAMNDKTSASNVLRAAKYLTDVYCGKDPLVQLNITDKPKEIDAIFEHLANQDEAS